jgi:2-dehydro-3-deoxyphosphogluconate aldolase/(4S)-4-hydroxy-2-oxoglutarate aldolase
MKKYETLNKLADAKIIAIIRVADEGQAQKAMAALLEGGLNCVELTFTTPFAHRIIEKLSKAYADTELLLGAGSVLDAETARIAILSGAKYLLTPTLNAAVIRLANRYGIPVMPGVSTPTEALAALEAGADVVKLFPAGQFKPSVIRDFKAPLPALEIAPTGGVSVKNINEWLDAGAFACGVGGSLFAGLQEGNYRQITQNAREIKAALR